MGDLTGRRILITGAASGIGLASARLFAREGARLALLDMNAGALEPVVEGLSATGHTADIADPAAAGRAVGAAVEALGGLDGLVHCAAIADRHKLAGLPLDQWQRLLAVNLTGTFALCQAAIVPLSRAGEGATIAAVASASGLLPSTAGGAYGATKAGVAMLLKYLAIELAPVVRVNSVAPGMVDTPMSMAAADPATRQADAARTYALQRPARPEEIAEALLFLTSWRSSYITGACIAVDGGRSFH